MPHDPAKPDRTPGPNAIESIHLVVAAYYDAALAQHGTTARGVDWQDDASHRTRHIQFLRLIEHDPDASILDLGCGYGDFLTVLRQAGYRGRYVGCDIAPAMIEAARRMHGEGSDRRWNLGAVPPERCDYAVASGILNVRRGTDPAGWAAYVDETIDQLAANSTKGFGFNMLTLSSDPDKRQPHLFYADPVAMLANCLTRYGRHIALLQDYGLWEFTVLVRLASKS